MHRPEDGPCIALGRHPDESHAGDLHVRAMAHAIVAMGCRVIILGHPDDWPSTPPDLVHYCGEFHLQWTPQLLTRARDCEVPFFLTARFRSDHDQQLLEVANVLRRAESACLRHADGVFALPAGSRPTERAVVLPDIADLETVGRADPVAFRQAFEIGEPYVVVWNDRIEPDQNTHLALAAVRDTGITCVVVGHRCDLDYAECCERAAAPATLFIDSTDSTIVGGAVQGASAVVHIPEALGPTTAITTAYALGRPVIASPVTEQSGVAVIVNPHASGKLEEALRAVAVPLGSAVADTNQVLAAFGKALLGGYQIGELA